MEYRINLERITTDTRYRTLQIEAPNHQIAQQIARDTAKHLHFPYYPETDETDIQINITYTQLLPAYEETIIDNTRHLTITNLLTTLCGINQHGPRFPIANQTQIHLHTDCKECIKILQTHEHTTTPNEVTHDEYYPASPLLILNTNY